MAPSLPPEYCDRRLLARIHRLTLQTLRKRIKPVEPHDFVRFLVQRHRLSGAVKWRGRDGVLAAVEQLQGFELAAGAWEEHVLPARVEGYDGALLDELCLSGAVLWARLGVSNRDNDDRASGATLNRGTLTRVVPIGIFSRQDIAWIAPTERASALHLHAGAQSVHDALSQRGALFIADLIAATDLLPAQVEAALQELAALGLVSADAFAAIRAVVAPAHEKQRHQRTRRRSAFAPAPGGRWSLLSSPQAPLDPIQRAERWCHQLLKRYGVVFRDLLARETLSPRWSALLPTYRRLEATGQVRGGRFVSDVAGEQFATEHAIEALRATRDCADDDALIVLSAADPLNLAGIITQVPRVPANHARALAVRNGRFVLTEDRNVRVFAEDPEEGDLQKIAKSAKGMKGSTPRPS